MDKLKWQTKPISLGGKTISPYFLAGAVVFILLVGIAIYFHLAPSRETKTGLRDLNLELFKQISNETNVESAEQAVSTVGSIAQELEKARGTLETLNNGLEKGGKKEESLSGLFVFGPQEIEIFAAFAALCVIAFLYRLVARKNQKN